MVGGTTIIVKKIKKITRRQGIGGGGSHREVEIAGWRLLIRGNSGTRGGKSALLGERWKGQVRDSPKIQEKEIWGMKNRKKERKNVAMGNEQREPQQDDKELRDQLPN